MRRDRLTSREIWAKNQPPPRGRRPSRHTREEARFSRGEQSMLGVGVIVLLVLAGAAILFGIGALRYGGPAGLIQRARAEVNSYLPRPAGVPTPLATIPAMRLTELTGAEPAAGEDHAEETGAAVEGKAEAAATMAAPQQTPGAPRPYRPAQPSVQLTGMAHNWQTWNNCGPATLAMNLTYFGSKVNQADIAAALRPNKDDANVSPDELAMFARSQNLNARAMVNGDAARLKLLLSNDLPVLIETWHEPKPNDGMGHYRLLVGYDEAARQWIAYDSYDTESLDPHQPYAGIHVPYDTLDNLWRVFNRAYVVIYDAERAPAVQAILAADFDQRAMWQRAVRQAQTEVKNRPDDAFGWFNLGSGFVALRQYKEAATAFDHARQIGLPWRMLWYQFGPFHAYYETGRYDEVITLADATLKTASNVEELYYWKGLAHKAKGNRDLALTLLQKAAQLNPNFAPAKEALGWLTRASGP